MRRTFWPCLALTAVLLAGCSDDPEPKEPDPSGSTSPEPTATPPPLPEAATQETPEGAAAFVDHYLAVLNYAAHTGDTEPLESLSEQDCSGCRDYAEHFAERAEAGGSLEGGDFRAGQITVKPYGSDTSLVTELKISSGTVVETEGSPATSFGESTETVTFVATYSEGKWSISQFVPGAQS